MQNKIDALFDLWNKHPGAGGQVLVIHHGKTIFEKCYGFANIETQTPMTPDSIFHVASVTKQFTAMSILILHERGLLNIYDDVRKYIPDLIRFPQPLTVKQLMNHVSGVRAYYELFHLGGRSMEDHLAQREARELIARQTDLNFEPGTDFLYTNANYMFLATIIERVSGMSFNDFATENIFIPLGMKNSFIRDDPHRIIPNKVSSYHDDGYRYTNAILTFGLYGGTSLHTTCRELILFLRQYMEPTLISRHTMDSIMLDIPEIGGKKGNYGCGVRVNDLLGHRYIHHGGVNAGYRTVGQVYPEDDLIIAAFTNTYNIPIETAARDIARIVLDLPERVMKNLDSYTADTVDIDSIAGMYYCDRNGKTFNILVQDGQVYHEDAKLMPIGGNLFKQGRLNITFAFGENPAVNQDNNIMQLRKITETVPQEYANEVTGDYYCEAAQGRFQVAWEDGRLWLKHIRFPAQPLYPLGEDTFFYGARKIKFCRDASGKVNGYLFNAASLRNFPFVKMAKSSL